MLKWILNKVASGKVNQRLDNMAIKLWISLLVWICCSSACCGQAPVLTLNDFEPTCIESISDIVTVTGTVDMTGADASKWDANAVDLFYKDNTTDETIKTAGLSVCNPDTTKFYCNDTDGSKYNVIYRDTGDKTYTNRDVHLRMIAKNLIDSVDTTPAVKYPLFREDITETLEIDGKKKSISGGTITLSGDNNITVKYSVSGLVLPYTVSILDSSNNVLDDSTTQPDVSTTISGSTEEIYVKYEMTGSCSKTSKIQFLNESATTPFPSTTPAPVDDCECKAGCIALITLAYLLDLGFLAVLFLNYRSGDGFCLKWVFPFVGALLVLIADIAGSIYRYSDAGDGCECEKSCIALIVSAFINVLIIVLCCCLWYCRRSRLSIIWHTCSMSLELKSLYQEVKKNPKFSKKAKSATNEEYQFFLTTEKNGEMPLDNTTKLKDLVQGEGESVMVQLKYQMTEGKIILIIMGIKSDSGQDLTMLEMDTYSTNNGDKEKAILNQDYQDNGGYLDSNKVSPTNQRESAPLPAIGDSVDGGGGGDNGVRKMKKKKIKKEVKQDDDSGKESERSYSPGRPLNDTRIHPTDSNTGDGVISTSMTSTLPIRSNFTVSEHANSSSSNNFPRKLPPLKSPDRQLPTPRNANRP